MVSEKFMRPKLLEPASQAGFIGATAIPAELYFVSKTPSIIIGMAYPARIDFSLLADAGVDHVVCLTHAGAPLYDASPCRVTAVGLQNLSTNEVPDDPLIEAARIAKAADAVIESVVGGEGVAVHCHGGRGRTGTVLGVALVRLGHDPAVLIDYLHKLHRLRSKDGWPESAWQAEIVRAAVSQQE